MLQIITDSASDITEEEAREMNNGYYRKYYGD